MREIKFRVYCGGKMFIPEEIDNPCRAMHFAVNGVASEAILMQYTGLKDKNGKEIYEGDVVEFNSIDGMTRPTDKTERHVIKFYDSTPNNPFSGFFIPWNRYGTLYQVDKSTIQVIGNIYENPELNENTPS